MRFEIDGAERSFLPGSGTDRPATPTPHTPVSTATTTQQAAIFGRPLRSEKIKRKKKETPRKKEKKRGEARTAADDREAKRKAVKRGERKKSMANESWATKIQGGDARKSGGAKRAKGICESVRGLHEAESRLLWLWLAFTRGRI